MDNLGRTNDTPLAAHLGWNQRIGKEFKAGFRSTYDVFQTPEMEGRFTNTFSESNPLFGEITNVASAKNLETEQVVPLPAHMRTTRTRNPNSKLLGHSQTEEKPNREKVISNMYNTATLPSPMRKNKWISQEIDKESSH